MSDSEEREVFTIHFENGPFGKGSLTLEEPTVFVFPDTISLSGNLFDLARLGGGKYRMRQRHIDVEYRGARFDEATNTVYYKVHKPEKPQSQDDDLGNL